jgi:branched-chain amino acid transport system ATP-binding protein
MRMLEVSNIDVYYGDLQALWDVSLSIGKGEIVTLVGSNGAGKSTTLKTISGLLRPRMGTVKYDGLLLNELPAHKIAELGISMAPEGRRLFPEMSVLENLEVGAFKKDARRVRGDSLAWIFEIFPVLRIRAKQLAGTLSGGEQQMLTMGRALMSQPRHLLIDEMSSGLAPVVVRNLSRILKQLNEKREITIFLVEQNVRAALRLAHRGYIMENGRIIDHAVAGELLRSDRVKNAYLGFDPVKG